MLLSRVDGVHLVGFPFPSLASVIGSRSSCPWLGGGAPREGGQHNDAKDKIEKGVRACGDGGGGSRWIGGRGRISVLFSLGLCCVAAAQSEAGT